MKPSIFGNEPDFVVRRFVPDDAPALCEIYYRSVHEVAIAKYDLEQVRAWAPKIPDAIAWLPRLIEYDTFVAIDCAEIAVGWIAMTPSGYIDMLFCLPQAIGRGVSTKLYLRVEHAARECRLYQLSAHASLLAEPFFTKHGWVVDEREVIVRNGVAIPRAAMTKYLVPADEDSEPARRADRTDHMARLVETFAGDPLLGRPSETEVLRGRSHDE